MLNLLSVAMLVGVAFASFVVGAMTSTAASSDDGSCPIVAQANTGIVWVLNAVTGELWL